MFISFRKFCGMGVVGSVSSTLRRLLLCLFVASVIVLATSPVATSQNDPLQFSTSQLPFAVSDDEVSNLSRYALIKTTKGFFEIRFFIREAPIHVLNFQHLSKEGFYDNTIFYRYIPNYIIQGGNKSGDSSGGTDYTLEPEFSNIRHKRGTVAMSRLRGEKNPRRMSNGSQFYISLGNAPQLDGLYSIFAEVVSGMDVVEKLRQGDKILEIKLSR